MSLDKILLLLFHNLLTLLGLRLRKLLLWLYRRSNGGRRSLLWWFLVLMRRVRDAMARHGDLWICDVR
jgi:hypothetical protein